MSDNVRDIRDVLLGLHSSLVGTHLGDVCKRAADEIDGLRGELAEKDKRIEELLVPKECLGIHIFEDQINAAWEYVRNQDPYDPPNGCQDCQLMWRMGGLMALQKLGIKACRKCGGTKVIRNQVINGVLVIDPACDCPNNGWKHEVSDE